MSHEHWARLEQLFAEAIAQPLAARAAFLERSCGDDVELRRELDELLRSHDTSGVLDTAVHSADTAAPQPSLSAGIRLGSWRIEHLIGRGGMGEVYAATRADAAFEQRAALKLLRFEAIGQLDRFHAERRILAKLEHPGIARLLDGGVAPDGRPYTVMEYVEGRSLTDFCRDQRSTLRERLALFMQVCDAVAFAHRNLVVHRDLKPANILVDAQGKVKLLDFGIAKLLDDTASPRAADTTIAPFTPDYAAPEQLSGQPVTTATDVYALGVLLFELLTGERPLRIRGLPSAQAMQLVLDRTAPAPSRIAHAKSDAPLTARLIAGDLDAIVAKCLRKEAPHRYETVNGLMRDLESHLRNEPVLAREGARWYVFGRLLRRYRWAVTGVAVVFLTLAGGLAATTWQTRRANAQAAQATATKDFLINVFRASDPRFASDKPRGEITAKELLDVGAARIEKDFASQPELQIELLGITADIYQQLLDVARFEALQKRRMDLARTYYGPADPIVIEGHLTEIDGMTYRQEYANADRLLGEVDVLLKNSGQDRTLLRAEWWRLKASLLYGSGGDVNAMTSALDRSLDLYEELAPDSQEYATVLDTAANASNERNDLVQQRRFSERAIAVYEKNLQGRSLGAYAVLLSNYARNLDSLGDFVAAQNAYERAEGMAQKTYGSRDEKYWLTLAYHARMLHRRGHRAHAHELFREMLQAIPADWKTANKDVWARGIYAGCLTAEGRAGDAIPLLETTLRSFIEHDYSASVPVWRLALGDAYDRAKRTDAARGMLKAALDETLAQEGAVPVFAAIYRERWGRFLLDHAKPGNADLAAAEAEFRTALAKPVAPPWVDAPLAHAGLARISIARGDIAGAVSEDRSALATLELVRAVYDWRVRSQLWLAHSAVLLQSDDAAGARQWAEKALNASRTYDDPSSPAIAAAESAVRVATAALARE